jgi:hypothetical protein
MRPIGRALSIVLTLAVPLLCAPPCEAKPNKPTAAARKKSKPKKAAKPAAKPVAKPTEKPTEKPRPPDTGVATVDQMDDRGYEYRFQDDPLYATSGGAAAARIHVRKQGARETLIRPRLHFIPELLKSVEDI